MYPISANCLVVVRCFGERSKEFSLSIVKDQLPEGHVEEVSLAPFSAAVRKTFELGIHYDKKWTIALDADVLLRADAIKDLIALGESLPDNFFRIEGMVLDRFFGFSRKGGAHLYRTQYLKQAANFLEITAETLRPESRVVKEMVKLGFHSYQGNDVYGIHDYYQYHRDVFRKTYVYAQKHKHLTEHFKRYWGEALGEDDEFRVALMGLEEGLKHPTPVLPDVNHMHSLFQKARQGALLRENPLPEKLSSQMVMEIISKHNIPESFRLLSQHFEVIGRTDHRRTDNKFKRLAKRVLRHLSAILSRKSAVTHLFLILLKLAM